MEVAELDGVDAEDGPPVAGGDGVAVLVVFDPSARIFSCGPTANAAGHRDRREHGDRARCPLGDGSDDTQPGEGDERPQDHRRRADRRLQRHGERQPRAAPVRSQKYSRRTLRTSATISRQQQADAEEHGGERERHGQEAGDLSGRFAGGAGPDEVDVLGRRATATYPTRPASAARGDHPHEAQRVDGAQSEDSAVTALAAPSPRRAIPMTKYVW